MPNMVVVNLAGEKVKDITLNPEVFGIEPNQQVIFDAIVMQRASMRQGTHDVKNRREVRGGGRKPYRQKGTGNARQGSIRAPQYRGGGIVFGPTPRSYATKLNRKVRRLALRSVLSEKVATNNMIVVDALKMEAPKTKDMVAAIENINAGKKALFVAANDEDYMNAYLSVRNIESMLMLTADKINVYDIVNANKIVFTEAAVKAVEEVLGNE
ncbi:50S ribosomal protein L4 [uncultured Traorella sp.]|uniref:50S ribosomal protein L4 n=1 Tax=uncultured Traorella sp. TaxID=1929048 RepID=UPI0025E08436|nr:50S ribosomal protein L4 [uncultured Traorella sp.]